MSAWPSLDRRPWMQPLAFAVAALLAATASGVEPAPRWTVPAHPLVTATVTLYQRGMPGACDALLKLASGVPGMTDDDLVAVQVLAAMRSLDGDDEPAARKALARALRLHGSPEPPPFASSRVRALLADVRSQLPAAWGPKQADPERRVLEAMRTAGAREPAPGVFLRAVDELYKSLEMAGAGVVLDLALSMSSLTPADRVQVALRQGILRMEFDDEAGARQAFRQALELDRSARLPAYAPPKTVGVFRSIELPAPEVAVAPAQPSTGPPVPVAAGPLVTPAKDDSRRWGLVAGGAGLGCLAAGVAAGVVALSAYQAEERAALTGEGDYYFNRNVATVELNVADGLYIAGAISLGVGAFLFLRAPGDVAVGAGAGPGHATVTVGGRF